MTVPRWDAKTASRRFPGEPAPPTRPAAPRRKVLWASLAALVVLAATVSATQAMDEERIGVCHATGSSQTPYVFLVVRKDGFEHGHHRHHDGDFFVEDLSRGCQGDDPVVPPADDGATEPAGNETPAQPADNATAEEPASGEAPAEPAENATTEEPAGNETPAQPAAEPAPAGDAAVRQSAVQDDFAVTLTLRVSSVGPGAAQDVTMHDQLPDVRRTWQVSGDDAASCVLDGRNLACWFGDLAPGEQRVVVLQAYTDRMPCGFALTNTAFVSSAGDAEARNDASSAGIAARAC